MKGIWTNLNSSIKLKETTNKRLARNYKEKNIVRLGIVTNAEAFKEAGKL